jgi:hypothetical protein
MTGTWIIKASSGLVALSLSGACAFADSLTLTGNARLTGNVRAIDANGVVELVSPLSPDALQLRADAVSRVEFSAPAAPPNPPSALVELTNGDLLPATVQSLDAENLTVLTADAGPLTIPRKMLKSLQMGIRKRKAVYTGPASLDEWTKDRDNVQNWTFAEDSLIANGPATAGKTFDTPSQFVLKFTIKWDINPNVKVCFADPLTPQAETADRYYLQFNGAGLEVKRESTQGQHFRTVILLPRTPDLYPDNELNVEIRVDRKASRITLLLNGQPEATVIDPVPVAPVGNGVELVNSSAAGMKVRFSKIEIAELDNAHARHRAENRGDPKVDSLISVDEDRWGGKLTSIREGAEGKVFLFKSDFQDEPLELRESDVSTVFFAVADPAPARAEANPFALRLPGDGMLRVSSCTFSEDRVTAVHPLLGTLDIARNGVTSLERRDTKPKEPASAKEAEPEDPEE